MPELVGGAMIMMGGASLIASSVQIRRLGRPPIEVARELIGDTAEAVPSRLPPDMQALLDQLD